MYPWQYIQLPRKCDIQTNGAGDCWLRILLMFYISQHKPWSVLAQGIHSSLSAGEWYTAWQLHRLLIVQSITQKRRALPVPHRHSYKMKCYGNQSICYGMRHMFLSSDSTLFFMIKYTVSPLSCLLYCISSVSETLVSYFIHKKTVALYYQHLSTPGNTWALTACFQSWLVQYPLVSFFNLEVKFSQYQEAG